MKKKYAGLLAVTALLVLATAVAAQGWGMHHEDIESIVEGGTYQDLVDYREEVGFNMMPWVDSEEDFELAQERHEAMEEFHENMPCHGGYGHRTRRGMGYMWQ